MKSLPLQKGSATVQVSRFRSAAGAEEMHLVICPDKAGSDAEQADALRSVYRKFMTCSDWEMDTAVFRRFFCADVLAAQDALQAGCGGEPCATSWIQQEPLPPARIVLWAHHLRDPEGACHKAWGGRTLMVRRGTHTHCWTTGLSGVPGGSVADQTRHMFEDYAALLADRGLNLSDHAVRTWLFVRDIDHHYSEVVKARRAFFQRAGLTPGTHYLASTGIEGTHADPGVGVCMDAYAVSGLRPEQVQYVRALDHLSRTDAYGVTFERGTAIRYPDRKHITISGTASIDAQGDIVHPEDLDGQIDRTLKNIRALLQEAGAGFEDVQVFTVYLRRSADRAYAARRMYEAFGSLPIVIVTAPVCRPGWLIEIEGEALTA